VSFGGSRNDELQWLVGVRALSYSLCFDTVGWATARHNGMVFIHSLLWSSLLRTPALRPLYRSNAPAPAEEGN